MGTPITRYKIYDDAQREQKFSKLADASILTKVPWLRNLKNLVANEDQLLNRGLLEVYFSERNCSRGGAISQIRRVQSVQPQSKYLIQT